jgi:hypothetical protein
MEANIEDILLKLRASSLTSNSNIPQQQKAQRFLQSLQPSVHCIKEGGARCSRSGPASLLSGADDSSRRSFWCSLLNRSSRLRICEQKTHEVADCLQLREGEAGRGAWRNIKGGCVIDSFEETALRKVGACLQLVVVVAVAHANSPEVIKKPW